MKVNKIIVCVFAIMVVMGSWTAYAQTIDVIDASVGQPSTYFVPTDAQKYLTPYYRWEDQDWGWTHNGLDTTGMTSATLYISAFDVDYAGGTGEDELDLVSIINGAPVVLGHLEGESDQWSYAIFDVTAFAAEIEAGLKVWVDIDSYNTDSWALTLAKSVLTLNGATPPQPEPGVPDPGSSALLLSLGVLGLGTIKRWMN
jgi:hypothetical protein